MTEIEDPQTVSTMKTRHIRDPKNADRVLTLVTRLAGSTLEYAFALNSPTRMVKMFEDDREVLFQKTTGDRFSRKAGRKIAMGRLDCPRTRRAVVLDLVTQHPYIAVLTDLSADTDNHTAARIAHAALVTFQSRAKKKAEDAAAA